MHHPLLPVAAFATDGGTWKENWYKIFVGLFQDAVHQKTYISAINRDGEVEEKNEEEGQIDSSTT